MNEPVGKQHDSHSCLTIYQALCEQARQCRQRRLLVLSGDRDWGVEQARKCFGEQCVDEKCLDKNALWVSDRADGVGQTISTKECFTQLGTETTELLYDAFAGFNANAVSAISGTLVAGSTMILLVPPLSSWAEYDDPDYQRFLTFPFTSSDQKSLFLQRLLDGFVHEPVLTLVEQGQPLPPIPELLPVLTQADAVNDSRCCTVDQQAAVAAILHVVSGHRRRPLVLRADRGRGKSSALGIAAGELLQRQNFSIVVTAPNKDAIKTVFQHALQQNPTAVEEGNTISQEQSTLQFIPPDELLRSGRDCDLLLVDEAAAIPVPILSALLKRYSRLAFATTVHGYEGSGRGFDLRFKAVLDQQTPNWHLMQMNTPVRWFDNDPLERWLFKAFLLNASAEEPNAGENSSPENIRIEEVSRQQLGDDETLLERVFALLVLAHYQTTPNDLRFLLDSPNLRIWCLYHDEVLAAVALGVEEGGFDDEMAQDIYLSKRRPRGHLIAQSLSCLCGFEKAASLRGLRIMRIAVHPALQRQGLGSNLLSTIVQEIEDDHYDWLGASFGATADALGFWQKNAMQAVRIGVNRDASSGTHPVMVLQGLSKEGESLVEAASERFYQQLPLMLAELFSDLEPALVRQIYCQENLPSYWSNNDRPDAQGLRELTLFSQGQRQYDVCYVSLRQLILYALCSGDIDSLNTEEKALAIMKVLQGKSWASLADSLGYPGKKAMNRALADVAGQLLKKLSVH